MLTERYLVPSKLFIPSIYEAFEKTLQIMQNNPIDNPLHSIIITTNAHWFEPKIDSDEIICSQLGIKIFKLLLARADKGSNVKFSFGFINLYFGRKVFQKMNTKDKMKHAESTLQSLAILIVENIRDIQQKRNSKEEISALLNENISCLKFVKSLFRPGIDIINLFERYQLVMNITNLLFYHYCLCIDNNLITCTEEFLSNNNHDFLNSFLKEIIQMRDICLNLIKNEKISMDKIVLDANEIIERKYQPIEFNKIVNYEIFTLEYFSDEKAGLSNSLCQKLIDLLETAYTSIKHQKENNKLLGETALKKLVQLLIKIVNYNIKWSLIVIKSLLNKIINALNDPQELPLLYNVLYCILSESTYNSSDFQKLFSSDFLELINMTHNKNSINSFIEENGILRLFEIVIEANNLPVSQKILLEKSNMILLSFPPLCENFNSNPKFIQHLLECCINIPDNSQFILFVLRKCFITLRLNKAPGYLSQNTSYLPILLLNFICETMNTPNKIPECFPVILKFIDLLIEFNKFKLGDINLNSHKNLLYESNSWNFLLNIVEKQK